MSLDAISNGTVIFFTDCATTWPNCPKGLIYSRIGHIMSARLKTRPDVGTTVNCLKRHQLKRCWHLIFIVCKPLKQLQSAVTATRLLIDQKNTYLRYFHMLIAIYHNNYLFHRRLWVGCCKLFDSFQHSRGHTLRWMTFEARPKNRKCNRLTLVFI